MTAIAQLGLILGLSSALSFSVELLQLFLPGRVANISDVVTNGMGGKVALLKP